MASDIPHTPHIPRTASDVTLEVYSGSDIEPVLSDLATLRINVFREYPYLYDGNVDSEQRYLEGYCKSRQSTVVVARAGGQVVGASTAMPLIKHSESVMPPLMAAGFDPLDVYYFGESVLLPEYRRQGIGHRFFDEREAAAERYGYRVTAFCAVQRPEHHPARPADYVPHDAFWKKRGYIKRPDVVASFGWRDRGEREETKKPMVFWLREKPI